jgi:signal peptidase I
VAPRSLSGLSLTAIPLMIAIVGCGGSSSGSSNRVTVITNGNSVTIIGNNARPASGSAAGPLVTYRVPSESMLPTFSVGQMISVDTGAYSNATPKVDDIVVVRPPEGAVNPGNGQSCGVAVAPGQLCSQPTPQESQVKFIKRVAAGPGDTISIREGHVILNGKLQAETFIRPCAPSDNCTYSSPIKIPAGYWFVIGDNRGASDDSRFWGPVPTAWIVGKVVSK